MSKDKKHTYQRKQEQPLQVKGSFTDLLRAVVRKEGEDPEQPQPKRGKQD